MEAKMADSTAVEKQVVEAFEMMTNAQRRAEEVFPGYFGAGADTKHTTAYKEYGYPINPTFEDFYQIYKRNGFARGAIDKTIRKTWQTDPFLLEDGKTHDETNVERAVREHFARINFWQSLRQADRKSLVGKYAGVIFRFADDGKFHDPVTSLGALGLNALAGILPVYEGQLTVVDYNQDDQSPDYGQPTMYQFNEAAIVDEGQSGVGGRQFNVHPDRVHIWAESQDVYGEYSLEAGLNALIDLQKIAGAGGEGFWKNAKNAPILNMNEKAKPQSLATMLGTTPDKIPEKLGKVVEDWQKGFDKLLMLQGIETSTLGVTLQNPKEFADLELMMFCASYSIPMKILCGSQTGERASTEDSAEWNETNMGRRNSFTIPNIMSIVLRLVDYGVIPKVARGWRIDWADLTEASADEKIERADKMAGVNQKNGGRGEVYSVDEIREVTAHEPRDDLGEELDEEEEELPDGE